MQKKITFRGRKHSEVLDKEINKLLEKIERFLEYEPTPKSIEVVVEFHDVHQHHIVSAHVKSKNYNTYAKNEGSDAHEQINEVLDRIYRQLRTEKEKLVDLHKHGCDKECFTENFCKILEEGPSEEELQAEEEFGEEEEEELSAGWEE